MKGFGIVIVAHGSLAQAQMETLEHVIRDVAFVRAIGVEAGDIALEKCEEILLAAAEVDQGMGVVFVTDMFGGSPSNMALAASTRPNYEVLYGVNMPALVNLARARPRGLSAALQEAITAGQKYMGVCGRHRKRGAAE